MTIHDLAAKRIVPCLARNAQHALWAGWLAGWLAGIAPSLVGLVLLAAAGLKLAGQAVSPFAQQGILTAPHLQALAVVWEILLGVWLMSGVYRPAAWLAAVGTFSLFALISGYLGWIGQANCGCFGVIRASPWAALAVDVAALLLLLASGPSLGVRAGRGGVPSAGAGLLLGAGGCVALLVAWGVWQYGSLAAALARLHGVALYAPAYVDFGTVPPGEEAVAEVPVANWTEEPVRLIGGTSDCSCITTADLPIMIEPNEVKYIRVILRSPKSQGTLTRRAELWTDCERQRVIRLTVGCRVVE